MGATPLSDDANASAAELLERAAADRAEQRELEKAQDNRSAS